MSDLKCPLCGGELDEDSIGYLVCDDCGLGGDESVLRRLVALPDPTEAHEGLSGFEARLMCERFGGEWKHKSWAVADGWRSYDHAPHGTFPDKDYSWRPGPPEPEVETYSNRDLKDLFETEQLRMGNGFPLDGETAWAEHPNWPDHRFKIDGDVLLMNRPPEELWGCCAITQSSITGWTIKRVVS